MFGVVLGLQVGGAVLEAEQVARRGLLGRGRRRAAEAELGPAHRDGAEADPGEVADRVHRDLRVVGAGLDAQVAVAAVGVEVVGREVRQLAQRRRLAVPQAEPVLAVLLEQASGRSRRSASGPEASRPSASPVSVGGASYDVGAPSPTGCPAVICRAAAVHACSSATSSSRESVVTSKAAKCSRSWAGVTMPAWCAPSKG